MCSIRSQTPNKTCRLGCASGGASLSTSTCASDNLSCLESISLSLCAGALLGDKVASWLDPLVAMALSVWLIYAWGGQAYYNVMNLVGLSATPQFLQKLTYLCWNHDPRILQIDTVRWVCSDGPYAHTRHAHLAQHGGFI